jgi:glutamate 5-kinase
METKLIAAELATAAGCATVITLGSAPSRIRTIVEAHVSSLSATTTSTTTTSISPGVEFANGRESLPPHTLFTPKPRPLTSRRFWILHGLTPRGSIFVDEGAYRAISRGERDGGGGGNGGRLLAAGVLRVEGTFAAGQAVRVLVIRGRWGNRRGREVGGGGGGGNGRGTPEVGSRPVSPDHFADRAKRPSPVGTPLVEAFHSLSVGDLSARTNGTIVEGEDIDLVGDEVEEILEFGRGLTNYNSLEMDRIKGLKRYVL